MNPQPCAGCRREWEAPWELRVVAFWGVTGALIRNWTAPCRERMGQGPLQWGDFPQRGACERGEWRHTPVMLEPIRTGTRCTQGAFGLAPSCSRVVVSWTSTGSYSLHQSMTRHLPSPCQVLLSFLADLRPACALQAYLHAQHYKGRLVAVCHSLSPSPRYLRLRRALNLTRTSAPLLCFRRTCRRASRCGTVTGRTS